MRADNSWTRKQWLHVLYQIVRHDDSELDADRVGGVESFVRGRIAMEPDPGIAEVVMRSAVEELFRSERVEQPGGFGALHLIDLAAAFRPRRGFGKLVAFLQSNTHSPVMLGFGRRTFDLRQRALQALEGYYPGRPKSASKPFRVYVEVLKSYLSCAPHRGYAFARLMELGEEPLKSEVIRESLRTLSVSELADVIRRLTERMGELRAREVISEIYSATFPMRAHFGAALEAMGGVLEHPESGPIVRLATGQKLELIIDPDREAKILDRSREQLRSVWQTVSNVVRRDSDG